MLSCPSLTSGQGPFPCRGSSLEAISHSRLAFRASKSPSSQKGHGHAEPLAPGLMCRLGPGAGPSGCSLFLPAHRPLRKDRWRIQCSKRAYAVKNSVPRPPVAISRTACRLPPRRASLPRRRNIACPTLRSPFVVVSPLKQETPALAGIPAINRPGAGSTPCLDWSLALRWARLTRSGPVGS